MADRCREGVAVKVRRRAGMGVGTWVGFAVWTSFVQMGPLLITLLVLGTAFAGVWVTGAAYEVIGARVVRRGR